MARKSIEFFDGLTKLLSDNVNYFLPFFFSLNGEIVHDLIFPERKIVIMSLFSNVLLNRCDFQNHHNVKVRKQTPAMNIQVVRNAEALPDPFHHLMIRVVIIKANLAHFGYKVQQTIELITVQIIAHGQKHLHLTKKIANRL